MKFSDENNKCVLFNPNSIDEIKSYFLKFSDAILVISSRELNDYIPFDDDFFNVLNEIEINKLFISGAWIENEKYCLRYTFLIKNLTYLNNRSIILDYDFNAFPKLEILRVTWDKKYKNLSNAINLKELSLWSYKPKSKNLSEFLSLNKLEELRIIQSNIESIRGLENFKNLKNVIFIANRNMTFDDVDTVFNSIEDLYIESCKKVNHKKLVELFPNIKRLTYHSNDELESLEPFLAGFKKLEFLNIFDTVIHESDNRYWKNYTNIKTLNFSNRKHFLLKRDDFGL
jgi:hypothetical protein